MGTPAPGLAGWTTRVGVPGGVGEAGKAVAVAATVAVGGWEVAVGITAVGVGVGGLAVAVAVGRLSATGGGLPALPGPPVDGAAVGALGDGNGGGGAAKSATQTRNTPIAATAATTNWGQIDERLGELIARASSGDA